jgi:hypothetical protein
MTYEFIFEGFHRTFRVLTVVVVGFKLTSVVRAIP